MSATAGKLRATWPLLYPTERCAAALATGVLKRCADSKLKFEILYVGLVGSRYDLYPITDDVAVVAFCHSVAV